MRQATWLLAMLATVWGLSICVAPPGQADYFNYPCAYPFVGTGGDVNVIVDAGGQYCDGPTEINWSHHHCQVISANVNLGALALAPVGGLSVGGFGGNGIGGKIFDCHYRCPDGEEAPFPNPPFAWVKHLVLNPKDNDCVGHMGIRGPSSTPLQNALPGNMQPGDDPPDGVAVPAAPGALPEGQHNPPALPGPPPPVPPPPPPPAADEGGGGMPGSPMPVP